MPDDALIKPVASNKAPRLGTTAIMAASESDLKSIAQNLPQADWRQRPLYMSKILYCPQVREMPVLVGPVIGAPYAAMILELILAWGVEKVLFVGWCGSLNADLAVGDLVVPTGAWADDGTSKHYRLETHGPVPAVGKVLQETIKVVERNQQPFCKGLIWTTDGVFRETPSKIALYKKRGSLAVEMEVAALFAVAGFRQVELGALLVVSDELFRMKWQPGFKNPRFKKGRRFVCKAAVDICREMIDGGS